MADYFVMKNGTYGEIRPLLKLKMKDGRRVGEKRDLREIQSFVQESLLAFHKSYKRQINPHIYKVSLSQNLKDLKLRLSKEPPLSFSSFFNTNAALAVKSLILAPAPRHIPRSPSSETYPPAAPLWEHSQALPKS